jgi:hypothetical protein
MHAPPKDADIPIATPAEVAEFDGIIVGVPTRFGTLYITFILF